MIRVRGVPAAETQILVRLSNGWTVLIAPAPDGTAVLAAWASHEDRPRSGIFRVAGGAPADGDAVAHFLGEIAAAPEVTS